MLVTFGGIFSDAAQLSFYVHMIRMIKLIFFNSVGFLPQFT